MSAVFTEPVGGRSAPARARQPLSRTLGGDPRLALEVFAVNQEHGGTAAVLRAIDHRLDYRCAV